MGRLAGFRYSDVVRKLREAGFDFEGHAAGSHEVWRHFLKHDGRQPWFVIQVTFQKVHSGQSYVKPGSLWMNF